MGLHHRVHLHPGFFYWRARCKSPWVREELAFGIGCGHTRLSPAGEASVLTPAGSRGDPTLRVHSTCWLTPRGAS